MVDPLEQALELARNEQVGLGHQWNYREAVKHCILCEEHLVDDAKRCPDCLSKHLLAIEAKVDEALRQSPQAELLGWIEEMPTWVRRIDGMVQSHLRGDRLWTPVQIAKALRALRKSLSSLAGIHDECCHPGGYCTECQSGPCGPGGCPVSNPLDPSMVDHAVRNLEYNMALRAPGMPPGLAPIDTFGEIEMATSQALAQAPHSLWRADVFAMAPMKSPRGCRSCAESHPTAANSGVWGFSWMISQGMMLKQMIPNICDLSFDELSIMIPFVRAEMSARFAPSDVEVSPALDLHDLQSAGQYYQLRDEASCPGVPPQLPQRTSPVFTALGEIAAITIAAGIISLAAIMMRR